MHAKRRYSTRAHLGLLGYGALCLALLVAAVDFHPAHPENLAHGPFALGHSSIYYPAAAHPGEPIHVEAADPVQHPRCAACLHRLENRGAPLRPVAAVVPADLTFRLCLAPAPSAASASRRPSGARAPPLS